MGLTAHLFFMSHNQAIGRYGENLAKNFLARRGYKILGQNVKLSYLELDLIAEKNGQTVIVEVKTRLSQIYGPAEEALNPLKLRRFRRGLEKYLAEKKLNADQVRADLITIDLDRTRRTAKIKHFPDVV